MAPASGLGVAATHPSPVALHTNPATQAFCDPGKQRYIHAPPGPQRSLFGQFASDAQPHPSKPNPNTIISPQAANPIHPTRIFFRTGRCFRSIRWGATSYPAIEHCPLGPMSAKRSSLLTPTTLSLERAKTRRLLATASLFFLVARRSTRSPSTSHTPRRLDTSLDSNLLHPQANAHRRKKNLSRRDVPCLLS